MRMTHYTTTLLAAWLFGAWLFGAGLLGADQIAAAASITNLNTWTAVEDPPHPGLSSSLDSSTQATLSADGAIPAGTDIGYQSVDGGTVASSTAGYYFSVLEDFSVAVDFDVTAANSVGLGAIGFGIGEDGAGANSAGAALALLNGSPFVFSGGARINDVTQAPGVLSLTGSLSGRFFVEFDASTGDITYGVSTTPGAATPDAVGTFAGASVHSNWNGDDLLLSFFLRSDTAPPLLNTPLTAGTVDAVFSNLEVLSGAARAVIPEPSTGLLAAGLLLLAAGKRFGRS